MASPIIANFDGANGSYAKLYLYYTVTQSITDNTSTIKWTLKMYRVKSGSTSNNSSSTYSIAPDPGTNASGTKAFNITDITVGGFKTLATHSNTYTHKADGTHEAVAVTATFKSGVSLGNAVCSGKVSLPTIPRASTVSAGAGTIGGTCAITISRKSSSFTHDLTYSFGGTTGTIATGVGTSYSWAVPASLATKIPDVSSGVVTITCKTKNSSGTVIGTKTCTATLSVPAAMKPALSIAVSDATEYKSRFGKYVVGKSRMKVSMTETIPANSAAIKTRTVSVNGETLTTKDPISNTVSDVSKTSVSATITDTRGRSASASVSGLEIADYALPTMELKAYRVDDNGFANPSGNRIEVVATVAVSPINTGSYANELVSLQVTVENVTTGISKTEALPNGSSYITAAPNTQNFNVKVIAIDKADGETKRNVEVPTAKAIMDVYKDYQITFGKMATLGTPEDPVMETDFRFVNKGVDMSLDDETIALWTEILGGGVALKEILAYLKNKVTRQKSALTIWNNTQQTVSTTTAVKIILDEVFSQVGDLFEPYNGGIRFMGSEPVLCEISGNIYSNSLKTGEVMYLQWWINNDNMATVATARSVAAAGAANGVATLPFSDVSRYLRAGDVVYLYASVGGNSATIPAYFQNRLSIREV